MHCFQHPKYRQDPLRCTMCGQEIGLGEEYWACNGSRICTDCLNTFARQEFAPCRETRGKEFLHDSF